MRDETTYPAGKITVKGLSFDVAVTGEDVFQAYLNGTPAKSATRVKGARAALSGKGRTLVPITALVSSSLLTMLKAGSACLVGCTYCPAGLSGCYALEEHVLYLVAGELSDRHTRAVLGCYALEEHVLYLVAGELSDRHTRAVLLKRATTVELPGQRPQSAMAMQLNGPVP